MCLLGNEESRGEVVSRGLEFFDFLLEERRIENDTIADDVDRIALEDAGRDGAQDVFATLEDKCVTCIRSALESSYNVVVWRENVHDFTFPFIAPLET